MTSLRREPFGKPCISKQLEGVTRNIKEKLIVDDVVVILDRLTRGTDLALAQVVDMDSNQKDVLLRTLQRGARVNNVYKYYSRPSKLG